MRTAVRREEHRALSFLLAVLMHGLIAAMLYFGVQWQTKPAAPVEVELWAGELQASPRPAVIAKPVPQPPTPAKAVPPPERPQRPDIAEEQPKPEKRPEKPKPVAKPEPVKKAEPLPSLAKQPETKPQTAKPVVKSETGPGKLASDKAGKLTTPALDASVALNALEKRQQAAEASAAAEAFEAYLAIVRNKIRRNMTYPEDGPGNPEAEFDVRLLPDMSVLDVKLKRSSGNTAFDEAVHRAILRAGQYPPLPPGVDFGTLRKHTLKYRLNDAA